LAEFDADTFTTRNDFFAVPRDFAVTEAELADNPKGPQLHIALAEADRLRVLPGPDGARRSSSLPWPGICGGGDGS
jgi:hypothetical protein